MHMQSEPVGIHWPQVRAMRADAMIGRRGFITGLISLVAAPAIVRAGSLMPVKVIEPGITYRDPYRLREWGSRRPWANGWKRYASHSLD